MQFAIWDGVNAAGFQATSAIPTINVFRNGGVSNSHRIKIEFPNNAIQNTWLRITLLANANTDLAATDVFYFGNAIGDVGVGNSASSGLTVVSVNSIDFATIRGSLNPFGPVAITNVYDINKDGRVDAIDTATARSYNSSRYTLLYRSYARHSGE